MLCGTSGKKMEEEARNFAGRTLPRHDDSFEEIQQHTWSPCHHENFLLRSGKNYSKNQEKSPSPPPLMELLGADIVRCGSRIDHIASYLQLHPEWTNIETSHPDLPAVFIVNAQVLISFILILILFRFLKIFQLLSFLLLIMVKVGQWSSTLK